MSPDGAIELFEKMTDEEKKKAIQIPETQLQSVEKMNHQQRRKWYREQKKKQAL